MHCRQTLDVGKKNKIFYNSRKEISRIAKFGGEMSQNIELCEVCKFYAGESHFRSNFGSKMVTFSMRNTNMYKICKLRRDMFSLLYNTSSPKLAILLILRFSF